MIAADVTASEGVDMSPPMRARRRTSSGWSSDASREHGGSTSSLPMPGFPAASPRSSSRAGGLGRDPRVNLIGPFLAIKHAAPVMKERGGGLDHLHRQRRRHPRRRGRARLIRRRKRA